MNRWLAAGAAVLILALAVFSTNRYMAASQAQERYSEERSDHLGTRTRLDEAGSALTAANGRVKEFEAKLKTLEDAAEGYRAIAGRSQAVSQKLRTCIGGFAILTDEIKAAADVNDYVAAERRTAEVSTYCSQALGEQQELEELLTSLGFGA